MSSAAMTGGQSPGPGELAGLARVEFLVQGMTCAACAAKVESRLNAIENVSATVNIATEKATVTAPLSVPIGRLVEEIERAGYGAEMAAASDGPAKAGGDTADDLGAVPEAIKLARATLATIRRNLGWAFGYNIAAIPLAAAGFLNPLIAGAAMAASSVFVVANSVRLRRFGMPAAGLSPRRPTARVRDEPSGDGTGTKEHAASCLE
jgi:cation transport ATPase